MSKSLSTTSYATCFGEIQAPVTCLGLCYSALIIFPVGVYFKEFFLNFSIYHFSAVFPTNVSPFIKVAIWLLGIKLYFTVTSYLEPWLGSHVAFCVLRLCFSLRSVVIYLVVRKYMQSLPFFMDLDSVCSAYAQIQIHWRKVELNKSLGSEIKLACYNWNKDLCILCTSHILQLSYVSVSVKQRILKRSG